MGPGRRHRNSLQARWQLADAWRRLAADATEASAKRWQVRPQRAEIAAARTLIDQLVTELCSIDPVDPRGVAMAGRLLRDGAGPVYWCHSPRSLEDALSDCVSLLRRGGDRQPH